jgi:hypothetical protein
LGESLDFVLWESVFAAPDAAAVLRGIGGSGAEAEEQRERKEAAGHPM